ncbi:MAG: DUF4031 domain-containing protein [Parachlamydiales bacterium]|jgi:hypothetical protein
MTTYVDNMQIVWRGKRWCHLVADSLEELHDFALRLELKREWFQQNASYPHYDLTIELRELALVLGATKGNRSQIIGCAKILKEQLMQSRRELCRPNQMALFE